ncbi:MAG: hypothetical protein ABIW48_10185 [Burkholderiales bacterium]
MFRLLVVVLIAALGICVVLWVFTRDRRYLAYAGQIFKIGVIVVLVVLALFAIERVI